MEEATECDYGDYKQLDKRLRGLSKFCKRFTLSFNPVYLTHWIYIEFFNIWDDTKNYAATDKLSILKTTHRDNRFLAPEDHEALESEKDEYFRNVYTYGNWGILGDVIFRNWKTEDLAEYKDIAGSLYFGLDFGFSSDPAAVIKVRFERAKKRILILDEIYERGLINTQLAKEVKPFAGFNPVTCGLRGDKVHRGAAYARRERYRQQERPGQRHSRHPMAARLRNRRGQVLPEYAQ